MKTSLVLLTALCVGLAAVRSRDSFEPPVYLVVLFTDGSIDYLRSPSHAHCYDASSRLPHYQGVEDAVCANKEMVDALGTAPTTERDLAEKLQRMGSRFPDGDKLEL